MDLSKLGAVMKRTKCGNVGERRTGAPMLVVLSVLGFVVG